MDELIQVKVYLDKKSNAIVRDHVRSGGFGGKGLSAAIRNIIREWSEQKAQQRVRITAAGQAALRDEEQPEP